MAKKRKSSTTRSSALEPEDDSEDEWEEIVEPSGVNPDEPTTPEAEPTYALEAEGDWHDASVAPPTGATVDIETSGEVVKGYKRDGVWFAVPAPNEDGSVGEPVPVQITRWKLA